MNIEWTRWAINEWIESLDYLEHESPSAAARISVAVVDTLIMLADHPYGGHVGKITGTREFAVPRSPFIIGYELDRLSDTLTVITVFDGRRRWPRSFPKE